MILKTKQECSRDDLSEAENDLVEECDDRRRACRISWRRGPLHSPERHSCVLHGVKYMQSLPKVRVYQDSHLSSCVFLTYQIFPYVSQGRNPLFYLKNRVGKRFEDIDLPPTGLVPKCLQQPGLGQAKARAENFPKAPTGGGREPTV